MNRVRQVQVAGGLALAAAALVGTLVVSPGRVLRELAALGDRPVVFAGALVVVYAVRPLVLWPISACSLLVGFVLGPVVGFPVGMAGTLFTCLIPYVVSRSVPRGTGPLARLEAAGRRVAGATGGARGVAAARLAPLPADPVSYAAGLAGVSVPAFVAGTLAGETPWVLAAVVAGSSMRTFTLERAGDVVPLVVGAGALAVLLVGGPLYRYVRGRPTP